MRAKGLFLSILLAWTWIVGIPAGASNPVRIGVFGDSITMGSFPTEKAILESLDPTVEVLFPSVENCMSTAHTLPRFSAWLAKKPRWDVIVLNFGLHDLINCSTNEGCRVKVEEYKDNLGLIFELALSTNPPGDIPPILVWKYTTPVPPGIGWRTNGDAVNYNKAAREVVQEFRRAGTDIKEVELYQTAKNFPDGYQQEGDVHFTPLGYHALGCVTAATVKAVLMEKGLLQETELPAVHPVLLAVLMVVFSLSLITAWRKS